MEVLEGVVRSELDEGAPRAFAILDPLVVRISNHSGEVEWFELSVHPKKDMGKRRVPFGSTVMIDRSDFREQDAPGYYHLCPKPMLHTTKVSQTKPAIYFSGTTGLLQERK